MRAKSFLLWFAWGYVLFIALWSILRLLFFDRLWWLAIVNTLAFFLFLPLPALLALSLWKRRWRLLGAMSIPTVAFGTLYGALFLPSFPPSGRSITVMSFNVALGNTDYAPLVRVIRAANPDIVGLQELTPAQAALLLQELAIDYPYNTLTVTERGQPEMVGILSRFPIESQTNFPLPGKRAGIDIQTKKEYIVPGPRIGVSAAIRIGSKRIQVAVVDLIHNPTPGTPLNRLPSVARNHYKQKAEEIEPLKQQLHDRGEPFLLLCDCNFTDTSEAHARLTKFAKDSFYEMGWGFGHTGSFVFGIPSQRIDYIWHSDRLAVLEATVWGDRGSSDHLPVVAKLRLD